MPTSSRCDVLLINPPHVSKNDNVWHGIKSAMPPLGLLSVASHIESKGFRVRVLDVHVEKLSESEVEAGIREANPRVVGVTVLTTTANASHRIARAVKRCLPECPVVFGGVHPEVLPAETLRNAGVDVVVRGDGEETFLSLVRGERPEDVRGISYRRNMQVVHNAPAAVETDLDKYPFPAYHLVPMDRYYPAVGAYKRLPAINMLMTRGCPGRCTFCNSAATRLRTRSADSMLEEIKYLRRTYGIREIQFYDDTFTVRRKNVLRFCELMAKANTGITWACFIRADCFDEKMARAMKRAGCHQVLIGVESGDDRILRNLRKTIDRERTRRAIEIARRAGIDSRCAFIFGSMGETVESMQRTIDFSIELDPDLAVYNVCTPYPGTELFRWAKEKGYLTSEEWSDYDLSTFLLRLPTVSQEDVGRMYSAAYKSFYMRPISIWRRLVRAMRPTQMKDLVHAFFHIILRHKLGKRGEVTEDWLHLTKDACFDFDLQGKDHVRITSDVREAARNLSVEQLAPHGGCAKTATQGNVA
ncbi:MAG: B12-binding domain-containing radical SAM protein [Planctomycetota bacterium]